MIIEGILNVLFTFIYSILGWIEIDISLAEEFMTKIGEMLSVACYLLPMPTVISIFSITIVLLNFRILISVLKTLWGILPLV